MGFDGFRGFFRTLKNAGGEAIRRLLGRGTPPPAI